MIKTLLLSSEKGAEMVPEWLEIILNQKYFFGPLPQTFELAPQLPPNYLASSGIFTLELVSLYFHHCKYANQHQFIHQQHPVFANPPNFTSSFQVVALQMCVLGRFSVK